MFVWDGATNEVFLWDMIGQKNKCRNLANFEIIKLLKNQTKYFTKRKFSFQPIKMYKSSFKKLVLNVRNSSTSNIKNPLILTPECTRRINEIIQKKGTPNAKLRIFIDSGGCSGFTSKFMSNSKLNFNQSE
jgi:hypothetical protein